MEQPPPLYETSPSGIALSVLAFLSVLVCIPPLIWHARNSNFPACCLILWYIVLNLFTFINPMIWPNDDVSSWWNGYIYCDINAKLLTGNNVGVAGALVCTFRSLARVMDTENATLMPSKGEKRRDAAFELVFCVVNPLILMILHYIVQDSRYLIYGIVGCMPSYHSSWVSTAVGFVWSPVILLVACFYCGEILPSNSAGLPTYD